MHRSWKYAFVLAAALVSGVALADDYPLTGENTSVKFVGSKANGKHSGDFKKLTGKLTVDGDKTAITVEIDTASITSDDAKLTNHLKSADFFNVKQNPTAKFVSTKVEKTGDKVSITGDLTLNGKTKSITFPATLKTSGDSVTLTSEFAINRMEFGMTYGKGQINDNVALTVSVTAKK